MRLHALNFDWVSCSYQISREIHIYNIFLKIQDVWLILSFLEVPDWLLTYFKRFRFDQKWSFLVMSLASMLNKLFLVLTNFSIGYGIIWESWCILQQFSLRCKTYHCLHRKCSDEFHSIVPKVQTIPIRHDMPLPRNRIILISFLFQM